MSEWVRTGMIIITITDFEKGKKDLITLLTEKTVSIASELLVYIKQWE
jgi:hypothetical protein